MDAFFFIVELIGTAAFAVSGAVFAINKRFDLFGVIFCAVITALGGGVLRDVLLSNLPPVMFCHYIYSILAAASAVVIFLAARIWKSGFNERVTKINFYYQIFDSAGLAVFTVIGMNTAFHSGLSGNPFFCIVLGMITGCGGGMLRDTICAEVPLVLKKRVYAVASLCGGTLYYILFCTLGVHEGVAAVCGMVLIMGLRLAAAKWRWDLPRAF